MDCAEDLRRRFGRQPAVQRVSGLLRQRGNRRGAGVSLGLIDMGLHEGVPDLERARLVVRRFACGPAPAAALTEHGTHSASLLVAQGQWALRGLVPAARLFMALVGGADGAASHAQVAQALRWLLQRRVQVIALPLGALHGDAQLTRALRGAHRRCVPVFAAAGNLHPLRVLYPARLRTVHATGALQARGGLRADCCRRPGLDRACPGTAIPGLVGGGPLAWRSGSSVACVVAAGLAALERAGERARGPPQQRRTSPQFNRPDH